MSVISESSIPRTRNRRRFLFAGVFFAVTVGACVLLVSKLTHTSWPLQKANWVMVGLAVSCYFASFVLRALGWQQLFRGERPGRARCLASVGAAAASGIVLPFRLDYLVKVGTFRRLGGRRCRVTLEAIALSIVSLGLVDAVAMLPLSISATATSSSFRIPLALVVAFGLGAALLLFGGRRLTGPIIGKLGRWPKLVSFIEQASSGLTLNRQTALAWGALVGCWTTRAIGTAALLSALGVGFSFPMALAILCLSAAASVIPLTSGGMIANVGATAGVLLILGVSKEQAVNFSLASGMLLVSAALAAAACGLLVTLFIVLRPRLAAQGQALALYLR